MADGTLFTHIQTLCLPYPAEVEKQIRLQQAQRVAQKQNADDQRENQRGVSMTGIGYDQDIYNSSNGKSKYAGYATTLPMEGEEIDEDPLPKGEKVLSSYSAPKHLLREFADDDGPDPFAETAKAKQISGRENEYHQRRFNRELSPTRADPFARETTADSQSSDKENKERSYADVMRQAELDREEQRVIRLVEEKRKELAEKGDVNEIAPSGRKRRWDQPAPEPSEKQGEPTTTEEPVKKKRSRWDQTPVEEAEAPKKTSRWDQTPSHTDSAMDKTATITNGTGMPQLPVPGGLIDMRFGPLSDDDLNEILPKEGYTILAPPEGYQPIESARRAISATPTPDGSGFVMQEDITAKGFVQNVPTEIPNVGELAFFKKEDMQYFGKLLEDKDDMSLPVEELLEKKIMRLLLKIKNGTPIMRKQALRQITENARTFGAKALFDQILPLLMERTLEDQERHLLVKVIDRILYKLDDLVRPYVHKILVVIEPLLIDEDYFARVEGREIISNLSKAAGLAHMISTMRPDIDHIDEYVRNTTARAFSVVASALGIPALLPFLKAVCKSKKSWQARHTGIKIIQQIGILMGCAVLPHLKNLVECIAHGLEDEQQKVRTITALALAALAEAAAPYGIESFNSIIVPLLLGIKKHRSKGLAAFLKAIGYIIPLMEPDFATQYVDRIMPTVIREFASPDEEMKKIVLKVIKQCVASEGVTPRYVKDHILTDFFRHFWVRQMALDKRNYKQVVDTTVEIANKVGGVDIISRIAKDLKDASEPYRRMVMETIEKIVTHLGAADIDERLEEQLIDGILSAFQEQTVEDIVILNGFGTVVNALGMRTKPYLPQICSTILWRLNNKSAKVRQQSADLISRIAVVMKQCGEEPLLGKLGLVLYEYLGEEYPEVLGSILGALKAIVNVVGMTSMTPPIKDLLPRLTPILRNRHEKVQENTIDLVGRIADRGAEFVSAREWMRICFELLEMLKAHKKGIRRAAVNTFGYIAKAIGPQDVLATLLNNLKVQERQNRVCTCVAIAIVAESCSPFTVIPSLMAEYRIPEMNVQNGVLKAASFLFEYVGEMGKDYIYAMTPLLEDALIERDAVHRQIACNIVKHIALGVVGFGREDACQHLLNLVWPNIFEQSPHVVNACNEAIEGLRVALGPGIVLQYTLQGLFHPARRVREVFWKQFNTTYVACQASMIPFYPVVEDTPRNTFTRHELMITL